MQVVIRLKYASGGIIHFLLRGGGGLILVPGLLES